MKLKTPYCFLAALLLGGFCFPVTSKSQSGTDPLEKARELFKKNDYSGAASRYAEAWNQIENKPDLLWEAGQCAWQANQLEFSIQCLEQYLQKTSKNEYEISFLLAQAFQHQYKFEDAIRNYKSAWKSGPKKNAKEAFIKNELLRCNVGRKLRKKDPPALVESLGAAINSPEDEYAPVPDAHFPGNFYFSAVRPDNMGGKRDAAGNPNSKSSWIHADIFQSSLQNG
ncbi:MAG TPA: hypothetical protein VFX48_02355, partial [Saprospiraceae bacterium]|nr:hypothetical protein [Saprospiraceae bacterium]